ncbi:hypothetical protein [Sorangium sp. So ce1151]|uniref:hypothetical protein n=1 Tax=Sorangium sp. So ce1151 TaxID=3133332 RepID=UPI003F61EC02
MHHRKQAAGREDERGALGHHRRQERPHFVGQRRLAAHGDRAGFDDADRRRITIALTPKVGRSTEAIYGPLVEEGNKALEAFSAAELEVIVKFLRLNRAVLVKHAGRLIELRKKRSARSTSG